MKKVAFGLLICALIVGCQPTTKSTKKTTTTDSSSGVVWNPNTGTWVTPTVTPTPTPTYTVSTSGSACTGAGIGTQQTIEYYKIKPIIGKGSRTYGQVLWSNLSDPAWKSKGYFKSDSRLNIRLLAKASPGQAYTNYGVACPYASMPYKKLQVTIGVKAPGASNYSSIETLESAVGDCSGVAELNPPVNADKFQIDVFNVKWDYDCDVFYANASTADKAAYCPYSYVWPNDCFEIELQVSTDYTKDMPR